jgi:PST family polysaccharide transporter
VLAGQAVRQQAGRQTLAGRAGRALGWSFTNTVLGKLGTVGIGIMLARLLGPHAFGTYAVAYVALRILVNLNDLGVGLAIVRWPGEPRDIAPTVATISLVTSVALYVACYFATPLYSSAMGAPAAVPVVRVLCLVVIVDGIVATPAALLQRHFRQDLKLIVDQVNTWLGTGLTAALAWLRFGAMSLALGRLAGCLAALILFVIFSPEPLRFGFSIRKARPLLRFGLPLAGSGVIVFAIYNVDQLVVGRVMGVTALGLFVLASNLSGWPVTMFSQPVRNVAPAAFARVQHDPAKMRSGFLSVAGLLCGVTLPICLMLSGLASPLIGFVYGARWLPSAQPLRWLAVLAALQILFELTYDYFVVLAMSRIVFTLQLIWLVVLIPGLVVGARLGGVSGAAMAETFIAAGLVLPWYLWELHKIGIGTRALAGRLWLPLTGAAAAGLCCYAAGRVAPGYLLPLAMGGLVTAAVIGLVGYRMRADLALLRPSGRLAAKLAGPGHPAAGDAPGAGTLAADAAGAGAGNGTRSRAGAGKGARSRAGGGTGTRSWGGAGKGARSGAGGGNGTRSRAGGGKETRSPAWTGNGAGSPAGASAGSAAGASAMAGDRPGTGPGPEWRNGIRSRVSPRRTRLSGPGQPSPVWAPRGGAAAGTAGAPSAAAFAARPSDPWIGRSGYADTTGPLPVFRDLPFVYPPPDVGRPPPLYRQTVAALRWDPRSSRRDAGPLGRTRPHPPA